MWRKRYESHIEEYFSQLTYMKLHELRTYEKFIENVKDYY